MPNPKIFRLPYYSPLGYGERFVSWNGELYIVSDYTGAGRLAPPMPEDIRRAVLHRCFASYRDPLKPPDPEPLPELEPMPEPPPRPKRKPRPKPTPQRRRAVEPAVAKRISAKPKLQAKPLSQQRRAVEPMAAKRISAKPKRKLPPVFYKWRAVEEPLYQLGGKELHEYLAAARQDEEERGKLLDARKRTYGVGLSYGHVRDKWFHERLMESCDSCPTNNCEDCEIPDPVNPFDINEDELLVDETGWRDPILYILGEENGCLR